MSVNLLTRIAHDWGERCFGESHMRDVKTRSLRCVEEAIELAQAVGIEESTMLTLISTVYSRPKGLPLQEAGGTLLTASVLCTALGFEPEDVYEMELRRCLSKPPWHFTERNQEKIHL
jgi:NTP pyrophosphatase (non-canonical NTP hydrolase)